MRVLLVDHDSEGLEAVSRAIRGVLELDSVTSKGDALLLLRQNTYDVLIACERCVDGSGLDLLGRTTRTAVPLKRIFAAAPDRLQLLGPRLAPFKVQRTINYPIDLEELWLAIAQVTGGPNDETDGTIERVVLDERGIPSTGTVPRSPIPPRPPAPLAAVPPPAPAVSTSASGRYATARLQQPVPEPPLRAPPPPRQPPQVRAPAPPAPSAPPARTSDTGRMRALAPQMKPIPPMPIAPPLSNAAAASRDLPAWTPEPLVEDDFAAVAEQARLGVQQKVVDEASRRRRTRLFVAGGVALAVAGLIVFLIEKFYDPEARAREQAIAQEVQRMAEQQKVTDDLTRIEIDIETAIMESKLDDARAALATLVEKSPDHPRREFLQDSIDRAAELAKLSAQGADKGGDKGNSMAATAPAPVAAAVAPPRAESRSRPAERATNRTPERAAPRNSARTGTSSTPQQRTFGAPIGEQPRAATIPLNAPINAPPTTTTRRVDSGFPGRTVEATDSAGGPASTPPPPATQAYVPASAPAPAPQSGSAVAEPQPAATASVDVTPAKLVKRVMPVLGSNVSRKASGFVVVRFTISEKGRVSDVNVVESTPPGVFDDAAQTAVRKWLYEPRKENGVAVASQAKARLVFDAAN
jgi:TonB family protein